MKKNFESKALIEVRKWKKAVAKEVKGLKAAQVVNHFNKYLVRAKNQKAA